MYVYEARDRRNVAFELSSDLLVCLIVQRNHSTVSSGYCTATLPHRRCLSPVLTSVQE